jgi:hypothetical protein
MLQYELINEYAYAYNKTIDKMVTIVEYVELLEREMGEYGYETFQESFDSDTDFELIKRLELSDILTTGEASEAYGKDDGNLRRLLINKDSRLIEDVDYRKSGKVWLITREAMEKLYGKC